MKGCQLTVSLLAQAASTVETLYQRGAVHDPTAAPNTFQCCHPPRSRGPQLRGPDQAEWKKNTVLPTWLKPTLIT